MRNLLMSLAVMAIILTAFAFSQPPAETASTYDEWEQMFTVDSAGTVTKVWPKEVRKGNPTITFQIEMDTTVESSTDTMDVTVYTSQFAEPDDDQWVTDTTFGISGRATEPVTVTVGRAKNIKFTAASLDSVSNTVHSSLWVN
jgi:hypothetical protein